MDPSSVITQVTAPTAQNTQQQHHHGSASSAGSSSANSSGHPAAASAVSSENDAAAAAANLSSNGQKGPKKRRRNFLCSIICCLGKKGGSRSGSDRRRRKSKDGQDKAGGGGGDVGDLVVTSGGGGGGSVAVGGGSLSPGKVKSLLGELRPEHHGRKCIVIDLDETLVHSSFKPISNADFIVPVEIDGTIHQVYVLKRPHVDEFLCRMGELFECVLFTASLAKYADPVADLLDKWDVFHARLFRESCVFHRGNYVKDLGRLGRDLPKILIVDNSPASYIFHPDNAVPVASWFDDMNDTELLDLIPFMEDLAKADSVYGLLHARFKLGNSSGGAMSPASAATTNGGSNSEKT